MLTSFTLVSQGRAAKADVLEIGVGWLAGMQLKVNGQTHAVPERWRGETLLVVLGEHLGLVGARHGCGTGDCGACTIHLDGGAVRSCLIPVSDAEGSDIDTIEGLARGGGALHPVQRAWLEERVVQCGFCQAGQIMQAIDLLSENESPSEDDIAEAMSGNLCRCGTQTRVRRAIQRAAEEMRRGDG